MTTKLESLAKRAQAEPQTRFSSLLGMVYDPEGLREAFGRQDGRKAPGVDGIRKKDYAERLDARLTGLSQQLRQLGWRPSPTRRVYIPKGDGRYRPLGLPSFEDRLVQDQLSRVLGAIWEPEFCECSYGFRPGRSAHDALRRLAEVVTYEGTQWMVEADIKGFFDHVHHGHLLRFLAHRISDPRILRLVRRFLKAGVMDDGVFHSSEEGTPQGGLVSPVLSNIYLHYVLDLWFEKRFARQCQGRAYLVRYADDFVACFEHEADARCFRNALEQRLAAFALEVEPAKTAVLRFGPGRPQTERPQTFTFLGFTHFETRSRSGRFAVGRKTAATRIRRQLKRISERLRALRSQPGDAMLAFLCRHLQGYLQYYGVSGNLRSVRSYFMRAGRLLHRWLNRRSQRRSINWERLQPILMRWLPVPRVVHNLYPVPPWRKPAGSRMV